mmetsp:Transcript_79873/g.216373  ORF Transcript_79873/g.216373 Transcript_79873/m.216373 type:complete len:227 (-) Transcript_79873:67-747(-)
MRPLQLAAAPAGLALAPAGSLRPTGELQQTGELQLQPVQQPPGAPGARHQQAERHALVGVVPDVLLRPGDELHHVPQGSLSRGAPARGRGLRAREGKDQQRSRQGGQARLGRCGLRARVGCHGQRERSSPASRALAPTADLVEQSRGAGVGAGGSCRLLGEVLEGLWGAKPGTVLRRGEPIQDAEDGEARSQRVIEGDVQNQQVVVRTQHPRHVAELRHHDWQQIR